MKRICCLIPAVAVVLASPGCGKQDATPASPTNTSSGNPLTAPADYVGAVVQAQKTASKVVDLASLKQSIQLFQASEERYPKDLDELVTKHYLGALPKPPAGFKFSYNPQTGEIKTVPAP